MIEVIVNPWAGYVARSGFEQLRSLVGAAVPDSQVVVLHPQDDVHARCQELLSAGATCIAAAG